MKDFLKNVLATIAGLFAFCFLLGFFIFMIVLIAGAFSDDEVEIEDNSVLKLSLDYTIPEKTPADPLQNLDFFSMELNTTLGLNDLLLTIREAANDDNIEGIYLEVSTAPNGMATLKALRDELQRFQESEKFVVAYSEMYSQKAYYLVSVADEVYLNPKGFMDFRGFGARMLFFKGMMDKIGVSVQPFYAGQYKSAFEPFTRTEMTDANREAYQFVLDEMYAQFLNSISDSRGIPRDELHRLADGLYIGDARSALDFGMVDDLLYQDEVMKNLKDRTGKEDDDDINWLSAKKFVRYIDQEAEIEKDKIAVLYAMGNIIDGDGEEGVIASANYAEMIKDIREDDDISALVLRVNSGGGSALASEIILREINLTKEFKPVIVSFGDVAASGGYYIACQSDYIFAEPNTITGSIGVFGLIPDFSGLMNDKLGITYDTIQTASNAVFSGGFGKVSDREAEVIQAGIDTIYIDFLTRVYEGRKDKGLTANKQSRDSLPADMAHIAEGRIWTGTQALELGLVDELGNLEDAVAFAAEEAGVSKFSIIDYPKREDMDFVAQVIYEALQDDQEARILTEYLGIDVKYLEMVKELRTMNRYQMRMPVMMEIY